LLGFFWPVRITDCPSRLLVMSTIRLVNFFVSFDDALVGAAFEELALSVDDIDITPVVVGNSLDGVGQLPALIIYPDFCDVTTRLQGAELDPEVVQQHDEWQTGHSFGASELKHLENAAREARTRIENWQKANKVGEQPKSAA